MFSTEKKMSVFGDGVSRGYCDTYSPAAPFKGRSEYINNACYYFEIWHSLFMMLFWSVWDITTDILRGSEAMK